MRKIVNRRIRRQGKAGSVVADVNAVVATSVGGHVRTTAESSRRKVRIVQRGGATEVQEGGSDKES